jgi:hypothetical protein
MWITQRIDIAGLTQAAEAVQHRSVPYEPSPAKMRNPPYNIPEAAVRSTC